MKMKTGLLTIALVLLVSCTGKKHMPKIVPLEDRLPANGFVTYQTPEEMSAAAKEDIYEITPEILKSKMESGAKFHLIDIRTNEEFAAGHIEGAIHIPRGVLEFRMERVLPDLSKDDEIVLYCKTGDLRSPLAYQSLKKLGYKNVYNLEGGWMGWPDKGEAVVDGEYSLEAVPGDNYETPEAPKPKVTAPPAGTPAKVKKRAGGGGC